ncbi:MAG TPA: glycosyltransferase, partial [Parvularculaceae bacterium]|nr:glycosyltransferase [Parvularculaceae bacterium]
MKVAYLVNQYPGISHSFVRREIAALERAGCAVCRFAARPSKQGVIAEEDKAEEKLTRYIVRTPKTKIVVDITSSFLAAPLRSLGAFGAALRLGWRSEAGLVHHVIYYAEAMALAAWLRRENLAHIHAHFGTNSATVAMLAAQVNAAGFSMTVHGPEEFDKSGLIGLPEKIKACRFAAGVSSYGASQLRRLVPPDYWGRIKIVRCGVEKDFHESRAAISPARDQFVSIGRLSEQKGQMTLIEAAGLLKEKGRAFTVTLIGDGEMRPVLEMAIRRHDVADRVFLAGWKTPVEVRAALERARALVLPSYAEGLPVSIMEAFSLARPVISTYIAGIPELVVPGQNGWLVPAGDAEAL